MCCSLKKKIDFFLFEILISDGELSASHDLLKAIEIPLRDETTINFTPGSDGFPAFVLFHGHDIKIPHKILLPEKLYLNFSIMATVKPESNEGEVN